MKKHYLILLMCYVLFPFAVNAQTGKSFFRPLGVFMKMLLSWSCSVPIPKDASSTPPMATDQQWRLGNIQSL